MAAAADPLRLHWRHQPCEARRRAGSAPRQREVWVQGAPCTPTVAAGAGAAICPATQPACYPHPEPTSCSTCRIWQLEGMPLMARCARWRSRVVLPVPLRPTKPYLPWRGAATQHSCRCWRRRWCRRCVRGACCAALHPPRHAQTLGAGQQKRRMHKAVECCGLSSSSSQRRTDGDRTPSGRPPPPHTHRPLPAHLRPKASVQLPFSMSSAPPFEMEKFSRWMSRTAGPPVAGRRARVHVARGRRAA